VCVVTLIAALPSGKVMLLALLMLLLLLLPPPPPPPLLLLLLLLLLLATCGVQCRAPAVCFERRVWPVPSWAHAAPCSSNKQCDCNSVENAEEGGWIRRREDGWAAGRGLGAASGGGLRVQRPRRTRWCRAAAPAASFSSPSDAASRVRHHDKRCWCNVTHM
jgi:hypothetical protein